MNKKSAPLNKVFNETAIVFVHYILLNFQKKKEKENDNKLIQWEKWIYTSKNSH